jgi:mRNA-degrading endonuclease RelE of RelBE toxin-antitoxin system
MEFIETPVFTRRLGDLLSDDEYRQLQALLQDTPIIGPVIVGTGGIRKVRWGWRGGGKRGGVRVIYYHVTEQGTILMLLIHSKSEQSTLTEAQKTVLRRAVQRELG